MTSTEDRIRTTETSPKVSAIKEILVFLLPYKKHVAFALVALLFTAGVTLFIGQGVRLLIDQGIATQSSEYLRRYVLVFFGLVAALAIGTFTRFYWVPGWVNAWWPIFGARSFPTLSIYTLVFSKTIAASRYSLASLPIPPFCSR